MMIGQKPKSMGIYIHIPFCQTRCNYCSFYSNAGIDKPLQGQYISNVLKEFAHYAELGRRLGWQYDTLYIGGGTPTVLDIDLWERLLEGLFKELKPEDLGEFTVEANPGSLTLEKLQLLKSSGCNRLSMGAQSFDPDYLKWLGRSHTVQDFYNSWSLARQHGWTNMSLDLMYGLKDQSVDHWAQTIKQALALEPEHISLYQLNVEPGTPLAEQVEAGQVYLVDDEIASNQFLLARELLTAAGYHQYEISNYAKPGYESQHNLRYWQNREYIGIGAGAAGYIDRSRYTNIAELEAYARNLLRNRVPRFEEEVITDELYKEETIILNLRTALGLDKADFAQRFAESIESAYGKVIKKYVGLGLMEDLHGKLRLTPAGFLQSNQILLDFIN
jgi:oxygen-independent coproporphyrinogen-3 oxidase